MLPRIVKVDDVEMLRDGGSLTAKFTCDDGNQYILLIPIDHEKSSYDEPCQASYGQPSLIDCDPAKRPADTDTRVYSVLCGPETVITWHQARELFALLKNLATGLNATQELWLKKIKLAVENNGHYSGHPLK